jgi:hypothetical protein
MARACWCKCSQEREKIAARTCEWVTGLKLIEFYTQQIARNMLDRLIAG